MVHMIALNCHLISSSRFARDLYRDPSVQQSTGGDLVYRLVRCRKSRERERWRCEERGRAPTLRCALSSPEEAEFGGITGLRTERRRGDRGGGRFEYLAEAHGWGVRMLIEDGDEMRAVARIQAEAFHEPVALFNNLFFQFFKAEVLAGLVYKLRNSPSNRYACLVAEPATSVPELEDGVVGVVDVTVLREDAVLRHLPGAEEYLYVSGIAVSESFRRRKVATALLKACEELCIGWGYRYLALQAHEDDSGARTLYANAGYRVVTGDPVWVSWIGKRRRVLMIKKIG